MMSKGSTVVLAFSGGLDTSFCVPWLCEQGHDVIAMYANAGALDDEATAALCSRALELGASDCVVVDVRDAVWRDIVTPLVMGGARYQGQYPLLCSDRYVIAEQMVQVARECGAAAVAHGCTAMGNDQVRFDQSLRCLSDLPIIAPIREIPDDEGALRDYELAFLRDRGYDVPAVASRYTVNENMLGATISGSEIDAFAAPSDQTYRFTAPPDRWPREPMQVRIGFDSGEAVSLNGADLSGPALLAKLNQMFGAYGVGRGMYTGDTIVGLKGRIVFESPGLDVLLEAHRALEEVVLTQSQNAFKPTVANRWVDLVFTGLYHDPLRADLEEFLRSTQNSVSGVVTVETAGGCCRAIAVATTHALLHSGATYAQSSDWSAHEAEGFIRLYGQSSALGAAKQRDAIEAASGGAALCSTTS